MFQETSDITDKISLRSVNLPEDEAFLKKLFFSTREEDFAAWSLMGSEQAEKLLEMQYAGQKMQYEQDFPNAEHSIILYESERVGRLWSNRNEREVRVVDITVLPEYRGGGIGSVVLKNLMEKAAQGNKIFALQVIKTNPAIRLYLRLGLEIVGENPAHYEMEWRPSK